MHAIKRLKNKTITIILCLAIALSLITGAFSVLSVAKAETTVDTVEFSTTSLGLSNTGFESYSGSFPADPTSWTGANVGTANGNVKKGVVDLTPSVYTQNKNGNKTFGLDVYDEYKNSTDIPKTIFGKDTQFGGDEKTLLINSVDKSKIAYAFTSSDMSFAPNSFYRISVWVKTGDFAPQTGATIKLKGLGQYFGFDNINTVRDDNYALIIPDEQNDYTWVQYSMYVRTSASLTKTVNLVLGVGDAVIADSDENPASARPATGYAFFDTVTAERVSAYTFAAETQHLKQVDDSNVYSNTDGTMIAVNLNETKSFTAPDGSEMGTFSANESYWDMSGIYYDEHDTDLEYVGSARATVYNSQTRLTDLENNPYGLTQNPWAPYGKAEYDTLSGSPFFEGENTANILMISTYDGKEFAKSAYGVASTNVTIKRFKYYRFSVWVKGDGVDGGSGISILVKGKPSNGKNVSILTQYTNLNGDSSDKAHYGWKEQVVYFHGSMLYDYEVRFELWLGSPASRSSGIAMFDNVTFTDLKYSDYSAMSSADGGNVYEIDDFDNGTNVANGNFVKIGDMDELKFPMPAADWTYHTPDTVGARGFSTKEVNTDNAIYGIIPTDKDTFETISSDLPYVERPNENNLYNVLLLSSSTPTAICYQSSDITLSTDNANKLTVSLMVGRINGYGASLVLKTTDGDVISTIENITDTGRKFKTFTFYLAAPLSNQTVNVEIWLGLNDRFDNTRKLSSGNVYVKEVALNSWTAAEGSTVEAEYNDILAQYKEKVNKPNALTTLDFGIYSFASPAIDYYDVYSYAQNDGLSNLYRWTMSTENTSGVKSGVFNSDFIKPGFTVYDGFDKKDRSGSMLYIFNTQKNRTTYSMDNSLSLVANQYYRIDVTLKVVLDKEMRDDKNAIGANVKLIGSTAAFENIKDTTTISDKTNEDSRDYETFQTYSFFVSTGNDGGTVRLEISLGGEARDNYILGRLVVGDISMTEIDNLDYEAAQKDAKNKKSIAVELSEATSDSSDNNTEAPTREIQWWIIPTIIFSLALLVAVVLIIVLRIRDKIKQKRQKSVTYTTDYDRSDVMRDIDRLKAEDEAAAEQQRKAKELDETTDDEESSPAEQPSEQTEETEQTEEQSEETEQPTEAPATAEEPKDDLDD